MVKRVFKNICYEKGALYCGSIESNFLAPSGGTLEHCFTQLVVVGLKSLLPPKRDNKMTLLTKLKAQNSLSFPWPSLSFVVICIPAAPPPPLQPDHTATIP